jgi:hypothetical protein
MLSIGVRSRYWLTFLLLFAASLFILSKLANNTLMSIDISHSYSSNLHIYWTTESDSTWTQEKSAAVYVNDRKQRYLLRLPVALSDITQLRVDPSIKRGIRTRISELSLYSLNSARLAFTGEQAFSGFVPNEQLKDVKSGSRLSFESTGNDPGFVVQIPSTKSQPQPVLMWLQAGLLTLLLMSFIARFPWLVQELRWVSAGLLMVATAITVMALLSKSNVHPDEFAHLNSAKYYASHYTPQQVCSVDGRDSYSIYGISRLDKREIAYYIGGRYLQWVDFVPGPDYLKLRFLNVALFFVMVLLAFTQARARFLLLPILLTPQAWYLFSYYNSDALSLFAVYLLAYQVFVPQSMLRRLLDGERPPGAVFWVIGLALIAAMQYWVKLNYMFYPIFLGMLAASWWLLNRRLPDLSHTRLLWFVMALGTALFVSWEGARHAINDFALSERIAECRELTADAAYKPSTPLTKMHGNLHLRERGVSFYDMLVVKRWPERIFYTGLGAYGYTEFLNRYLHYEIVSGFIVALLFYILLMVSLRGGAMGRLSALSLLAAMTAVTLAAAYANWTQDFQPQGRYLLVYLPLLGTLMALYRKTLSTAVISLLASVPFALGLYSYFSIALVEILS